MSSQNNTPNLRSSSSISRTSTPGADLSEREKRRAQNRENLRAHYGLQGKKGEVEDKGENGREVAGDPLDPGELWIRRLSSGCLMTGWAVSSADSPAFSPDKYYQHLISTASLPQLLRESTTLSTGQSAVHETSVEITDRSPSPDVKDLNSSRHALVYNHHHQVSYPRPPVLSCIDPVIIPAVRRRSYNLHSECQDSSVTGYRQCPAREVR